MDNKGNVTAAELAQHLKAKIRAREQAGQNNNAALEFALRIVES